MAHAGIDQRRDRPAGEEGTGETDEYRRPASAPGGTHGEGARAHRQDLSSTRRRDGRCRRGSLERRAADVAASLEKVGKGRGGMTRSETECDLGVLECRYRTA